MSKFKQIVPLAIGHWQCVALYQVDWRVCRSVLATQKAIMPSHALVHYFHYFPYFPPHATVLANICHSVFVQTGQCAILWESVTLPVCASVCQADWPKYDLLVGQWQTWPPTLLASYPSSSPHCFARTPCISISLSVEMSWTRRDCFQPEQKLETS